MKLQMSDEVRSALKNGDPVVALESTIIAHGMPYPDNLDVAGKMASAIRVHGAVPAIALIAGGVPVVGTDNEMLDHFAKSSHVLKCSRADFAWVLSHQLDAATTVASTMMIAHAAGIDVFATGGIGGVHRGAETSFDISADLREFTLSDVLVVSAGAKAILDLPKTLEVLETLGVPVIGYQTSLFPAFYSRSSSLPLQMRVESANEAALFWQQKKDNGISGGVLLANPIPASHEIPNDRIERELDHVLAEAENAGIKGKALTPFLLQKLNLLTSGKSQIANTALAINNADIAGQIAVAICRIR
jgi:pseudouridine-5'-phosphate glycosidase